MTLVAGLSIGGTPAFVGDLLTSWRVPTQISLPVRPALEAHKSHDGFFASGLAQKLVIVRPYLLLAWAGSVSAAKTLVVHLDEILPETGADFVKDADALFSALNELPKDIEVVAVVIDEGWIRPFCVNTRGFEIDGQRVYLLGSGAKSFFEFLLPTTEVIPNIETEGGLVARAVMMRFIGHALMAQHESKFGLEQSWGGGFEVAYVSNVGFAKADNVLVRAWGLLPKDELGNIGVSFLMHYEGANLKVTSFGNSDRSDQTVLVKSWLKDSGFVDLRRQVNPEWTIDLFHRVEDGYRFCAVQCELPWSKNHAIFRFDEGGIIGWEMDKKRVAKLLNRIAESERAGQPFTASGL